MDSHVDTRIFVISDTHGEFLNHHVKERCDVAIHCGDLTEESKLKEFKTTIELLKQINAPLKLVIAGNRDFTMDEPTFQKKIEAFISLYGKGNGNVDGDSDSDHAKLEQEYGALGEARALFETKEAREAGIVFLDEGIHRFSLKNNAVLTIYASPYTPISNNIASSTDASGDMGFQYNPKYKEHDWKLDSSVDIVATHGPPLGLLDRVSKSRAGSSTLFEAVARARPKLHCFGHIHSAWGAKLVTWKEGDDDGLPPSHFTSIDNDKSIVIETLASNRERLDEQGFGKASMETSNGTQTLFVNAAIEGPADHLQQWPWLVNIKLPRKKLHESRKRKSSLGVIDCNMNKEARLSGSEGEQVEQGVDSNS